MAEFKIYKGLQKPLVFRGFKGKFIYWGLGFCAGGVVLGGIVSTINGIASIVVTVIAIILGLYYTVSKQKKGLYNKNIDKNVIIHYPNNLKRIKRYGEKQRV